MYPAGSKYEPVPPHNEMNLTKEQKSNPVDPDKIIPLYKAEITFLDSQIGKLIQTLKKMRNWENTLIILVADHGESMVEKNIYFCHAGMYNPVLHVPFIISFPKKLPQGLKVTSLTSSVDIFPTVLNILDIRFQSDKINGKSLLPTFSNPGFNVHPYIISEAYKGVIRVVYKDEYKFIKPFPTDWACKESHLFQSWLDYNESIELKKVNAEIAEEMERLMGNWLKNARKNALKRKKRKKLDKKTEEALKTLGYLDD
jgi:arylsulfatase A-like enzyme